MNEMKLSDSIQNFKHYFLQNRDFYNVDERGQKEEISKYFAHVFSQESVLDEDFSSKLLALFSDKKVAKVVIWLAGGSFYQCQRFIDLLKVKPSNASMQRIFNHLLFSNESLKNRVNKFKSAMDSVYRANNINAAIQLNLISQFMGLSQPDHYYIYKSQEFTKAEKYFEFEKHSVDSSAGGKYEHYFEFSHEILDALHSAGLTQVDYIDVQTFIYRDDWYSEWKYNDVADQYEKAVRNAQKESVKSLLEKIGKRNAPQPPRTTRNTYYYRDPNIAALIKKLASGKCDLCGNSAPFENTSGSPYLENHHIVHLANEGKDVLGNCVALCPNCHTKMHVLNLENDQRKLSMLASKRVEMVLDKAFEG